MENIYVQVILRTLFALVIMLVLARINGAKEIAQLSFFDYIVGITAGSIGAELAIDYELNVWTTAISLALFMLTSLLISWLTNKSIVLRRVITGSPIVLIKGGEISYGGLKRARFDVNDMLRELRSQGYFDVTAINCAVLETNGKISVLLKSTDRPATASEQGMSIEEETVPANVIIDGKILKGNLAAQNKSIEWLNAELKKQGIENKKSILLATLDDGALSVFKKEDDKSRTVFQ